MKSTKEFELAFDADKKKTMALARKVGRETTVAEAIETETNKEQLIAFADAINKIIKQ